MRKKRKLLRFVTIILCISIIIALIIAWVIKSNKNNNIESIDYQAIFNNADSTLIANYIKEGVTIGGITGKLKILDTSDATAKSEEIIMNKTAYVDGNKVVGTLIKRDMLGVGDYVEYSPDKASNYSLLTSVSGGTENQSIPQENLKWRVLNINDDGSIDLISDHITSNQIGLYGPLGYNNGVYVIDDICKTLYSNSSLKAVARNLKLEDIEKHMSDTAKTKKNEYISNGNIKYGATKKYSPPKNFYPLLYSRENGFGINLETNSVNNYGIRFK